MTTTITRTFARYIALPIVSAGIIGGAALGMAGMANAATRPQPSGPGLLVRPAASRLTPRLRRCRAGTATTASGHVENLVPGLPSLIDLPKRPSPTGRAFLAPSVPSLMCSSSCRATAVAPSTSEILAEPRIGEQLLQRLANRTPASAVEIVGDVVSLLQVAEFAELDVESMVSPALRDIVYRIARSARRLRERTSPPLPTPAGCRRR